MSNSQLKIFTFLVLMLATRSSQADLIINTTGSASGGVGIFGENTSGTQATFGQTFTVSPSSTILNEFAFFPLQVTDPPFTDSFDYSFHLARWNGLRADGPILFSSPRMSTTNNGGAGGPEEVRFQINQELDAGEVYVAFLTAEGHFDGEPGGVTFTTAGSSTSYADGEYVFARRFDDFSQLTSTTWNFNSTTNSGGFDAHFEAVFSAVPEPSAVLCLSIGLLACFGQRRRRQDRCV